jgi:YD repeat-containing protein
MIHCSYLEAARTWLLIPCLFVLISCGSDDPSDVDVTPEPTADNCLLQKRVSPTQTITVTRNSKGLTTRIDYDYNYQNVAYTTSSLVEYDASDRVVKIIGKDYSFAYEYDSQGKITLEKYEAVFDPTKIFTYPYERSFFYNDVGHLVKIAWDEYTYERYEYDATGNLIKQFLQTTTQPEYLTTEYLSYDNEKSPYADFPFLQNTYLGTAEVYAIVTSYRPIVNKSNILSVKTYLASGTSTTQNPTYQYNEGGYATSVNQGNVSYTYECK